ncbi:MAG: ribonuclease J [Acidobacteria bacterium]|nr:MAG: ribonuclease J [Acidobacteriota bacterium]
MADALEVIPLGGLGEFGMNCTALRFGGDMIVLDAGVGFPTHELGVDFIVPDLTFLKENESQVRGILLTHGHEDHAGGIPYVINELPVPVYANRLTQALVTEKLKEHGLLDRADLRTLESRQTLQLGAFEVEALHMTHSFPDAFCFAIKTPVGTIIWTGDFKFDQTPVDRRLSDVARLSEYGEKGVLALFSDSTNSEARGLCPSEFSVYEPLRNLFLRARRKIVVSCFASSLSRVQVILDLAREQGRKVAPIGRSMVAYLRAAFEIGYLRMPSDLLISLNDVKGLPPEEVVILATGSQGEPMSALSRLAINEVKNVEIEEGDLVILSARIIPGNEKLISNMINHFYRRGAQVYDSNHSQVHVSGHGYREDLKLMMNLVRPRFFIPIHGEFKQLKTHYLLARDQGLPAERARIIENGDVLQLTAKTVEIVGKLTAGRRFIEEGIAEEVGDLVLRDRRYLSEDGLLVVVLRMDRLEGYLIGEPELISRGFVDESAEWLMEGIKAEVTRVVRETNTEEKRDEELFKEILRKEVKRFLRKQTGKRPVILPVTLEI